MEADTRSGQAGACAVGSGGTEWDGKATEPALPWPGIAPGWGVEAVGAPTPWHGGGVSFAVSVMCPLRLALLLPSRRSDLLDLLVSIGRLDAVAVVHESGWRDPGADFEPDGFSALYAQVQGHRPRVGHTTGFELGSEADGEATRRAAWLTALRRDHDRTPGDWLSAEAGASRLAGLSLCTPVPLPFTQARARRVRARLTALATISGTALLTTSLWSHRPPDLDRCPTFFHQATNAPGLGVRLDLYSMWRQAERDGLDADAFIAALPLERVVEVCVSGAPLLGLVDPAVDALSDYAVPEAVFELLSRWVAHLPGLRQVTLRRAAGTLRGGGLAGVEAELDRLRALVLHPPGGARPATPPPASLPAEDASDPVALEAWLADLLLRPDEVGPPPDADAEYAAALDLTSVAQARARVAGLRFERVLAGSRAAGMAFAADPEAMRAQLVRYHASVLPREGSVRDEAAAWHAFLAGEQ